MSVFLWLNICTNKTKIITSALTRNYSSDCHHDYDSRESEPSASVLVNINVRANGAIKMPFKGFF